VPANRLWPRCKACLIFNLLAILVRRLHAMNASNTIPRRRAIEMLGAGTLMATALRYAPAGDKFNTKPRILFFSKSSGYEHDVVRRRPKEPSLSEMTLTEIGRVHGFDVIATKDGEVFDGNLAQYDAFFFFTTGNLTEAGTDNAPPMSGRGKEALLAAIRDGKGFIGVHSASDTFHSKGRRFETQQEPDPYIAMLGGEFLGHGSQQETRVSVVDANFPGLRGLSKNFTLTEEWYSLKNFRQDNHVLFVLETAGMHDPDYKRPPFPIAWARKEGKGRVYYNAMGHREDIWMSERFHQILAGAVAWATGRADAELDKNMSVTTPQAWMLPPEHD
jgi:type 1 glutamine amidotransferase